MDKTYFVKGNNSGKVFEVISDYSDYVDSNLHMSSVVVLKTHLGKIFVVDRLYFEMTYTKIKTPDELFNDWAKNAGSYISTMEIARSAFLAGMEAKEAQ